MLKALSHHEEPFSFFHSTDTFSKDQCSDLRALFGTEHNWQAREESFYQCFLRDVSKEIPNTLKQEVLERMKNITGLPLTEHVHITAQRMEAGQSVGVHSDQPLLGYEVARLVVQLNREWTHQKGGQLALMKEKKGPAIRKIEPHENHSFGFVLHPKSFHSVDEVHHPRWSLVFNFWHKANTPKLAEAVEKWTSGLNVAALPKELDMLAMKAESHLPEETTYQAFLVAWILLSWGYEESTIVDGYAVFVGAKKMPKKMSESFVAIRLAHWIAILHQGYFSIDAWKKLHNDLENTADFTRLNKVKRFCALD